MYNNMLDISKSHDTNSVLRIDDLVVHKVAWVLISEFTLSILSTLGAGLFLSNFTTSADSVRFGLLGGILWAGMSLFSILGKRAQMLILEQEDFTTMSKSTQEQLKIIAHDINGKIFNEIYYLAKILFLGSLIVSVLSCYYLANYIHIPIVFTLTCSLFVLLSVFLFILAFVLSFFNAIFLIYSAPKTTSYFQIARLVLRTSWLALFYLPLYIAAIRLVQDTLGEELMRKLSSIEFQPQQTFTLIPENDQLGEFYIQL